MDIASADESFRTARPPVNLIFCQIGTTSARGAWTHNRAGRAGGMPVSLFTVLGRFMHRPGPTPPLATPALFDDGLVEIARLIEVDDPVKAAPLPVMTRRHDA